MHEMCERMGLNRRVNGKGFDVQRLWSDDKGRAERPRRDRTALEQLPDEKIMSEVQSGSGDAFAVLFDRYHRLVLFTALKIVRDAGEAEDVTQNVFLEIYQAARQFDPSRGNLKVWLLQFAYHRSINRRNYLVLRQFYDRGNIEEAVDWENEGVIAPQLATQEAIRLVDEALATLNEAQRRTIHKVFFEGMTLKELAEQTKESFSNVRNHYYRGLDRLRVHLTARSRELKCDPVIPRREVGRAKA
jgi:RNA polymerase sigma-70 factor, ECF subfamily